jgi:hypothetical protein
MSFDLPGLHPAAARTLDAWHAMIGKRDLSGLRPLLHADATFRSPVAFTPYRSAAALELALGTVVHVFEDFVYHRRLASADGLSVVLEFSARIGDRRLKGIDLVRFDEAGLIVDFEVMVRPASGMQALMEEMGRRLGPRMAAFKAQD